MHPIRSAIAAAALSALFLADNASAAATSHVEDATAKLAAAASPMAAGALEKLYSNRTWKWKTGGGFFSSDRKRFTAWSRDGRTWSYAEGRWYTTDGGKLCMRAVWTSKGSSVGNITCFLHREKHGVVYQKPSLGGKWYVFRHKPVQRDDEVRKLVKGDRVSREVSRIKAVHQ